MFKFCCLCSKDRLTDGGVETKQTQWMCARCWIHFNQKKAGHKALLSSVPHCCHGKQQGKHTVEN